MSDNNTNLQDMAFAIAAWLLYCAAPSNIQAAQTKTPLSFGDADFTALLEAFSANFAQVKSLNIAELTQSADVLTKYLGDLVHGTEATADYRWTIQINLVGALFQCLGKLGNPPQKPQVQALLNAYKASQGKSGMVGAANNAGLKGKLAF